MYVLIKYLDSLLHHFHIDEIVEWTHFIFHGRLVVIVDPLLAIDHKLVLVLPRRNFELHTPALGRGIFAHVHWIPGCKRSCQLDVPAVMGPFKGHSTGRWHFLHVGIQIRMEPFDLADILRSYFMAILRLFKWASKYNFNLSGTSQKTIKVWLISIYLNSRRVPKIQKSQQRVKQHLQSKSKLHLH